MSRRYKLRLIHDQRTYSTPEVTVLFHVRPPTVSRWRSKGLTSIDDSRPHLYLGSVLKAFLASHAQPRQPLKPGEIFCTPCKRPQVPVGASVKLIPRAPTNVDFKGTCPACGREMYRRVRIADIGDRLGECRIACEDDKTTMCSNGVHPQIKSCEE